MRPGRSGRSSSRPPASGCRPTARYHRSMTITAPDAEAERAGLAPAAALFRSLGDPARLMIVRRLVGGPARVTDLTAALGLAQSTVSGHLACLRDCGLVTSEPVGRSSLFRLTQPSLIDVLAAAEEVLAATGSAVTLCPNFGSGGKADPCEFG